MSGQQLPRAADVVIIGGGIVGLALAYELRERQAGRVVVLEQRYIGSGGSGRNVGRIRGMQLTESLTRVAVDCQRKIDGLAEELGRNVLFYRGGYLWLLYDDAEVDRMRPIVEMHARLGVGSELLSADDVYRDVPELRGGDPVAGGVLGRRDGIVHHDALVWAYYEAALARGVVVAQRTTVLAIRRAGDRVVGITTDAGDIDAPVVVNAAGDWARPVAALAGVNIPNAAVRREVLVTAPVRAFLRRAITFYRPTEGWFNQTLRGEVVGGVIDPRERAGINVASSFDFLVRTARVLVRKMPMLAGLTVIRQWAGMYDVTPDHLPLVGPTRQLEGLFHANGWSGRGVLLGPLSAALLADRIVNGRTHPYLRLFDPDRFPPDVAQATVDDDYYERYAREAKHAKEAALKPASA